MPAGAVPFCVFWDEKEGVKMLRLPEIASDVVREIITEQMIWGFQQLFECGTPSGVNSRNVEDFLEAAPHINTQNGISQKNLYDITRRLEGMYQNLLDKEGMYTWDEFGEFLMDEILMHLRRCISKEKWKEVGTYEQRQEIYGICKAYATVCTIDEKYIESGAYVLYRTILYLPDLAYNRGYEYVLYWDGDFVVFRGWDAMAGEVPKPTYTVCTLDGEYVNEV